MHALLAGHACRGCIGPLVRSVCRCCQQPGRTAEARQASKVRTPSALQPRHLSGGQLTCNTAGYFAGQQMLALPDDALIHLSSYRRRQHCCLHLLAQRRAAARCCSTAPARACCRATAAINGAPPKQGRARTRGECTLQHCWRLVVLFGRSHSLNRLPE